MRQRTNAFFLTVVLCAFSLTLWAQATVKVGVLLPLKEQSARGMTFIEFYRGLLMAVDQVKQEGTNIDLYAFDCGTSETSMRQTLANPQLASVNVIFGPADAVQVASLSEYCKQHRIRMVLPFNTPCSQVHTNPWIYQVGVAQELLYPGISTLVMKDLQNSNFVFYHSGEKDERGESFSNHLMQVLRLSNMQTTTLAAGGDEYAYDRAFNQFRQNVVISDNRSLSSLNKMLAGIKDYQARYPQYKIVLFGYPEWLTYAQTMIRDYYQFDTRIFSAYYRNPLSGRVVKFEQRYRDNFGSQSRLSYPRAESLGYDLGYYFMHGLATLGPDRFETMQGTLEQQPLQHTFRFERLGTENGGFANINVQLVHYTTNNTIQIVR